MTIFPNFQKFYEYVSDNDEIRNSSDSISNFCEAVQKINVGCGCQKKSRVARAERFYLALAHEMTAPDKELLQQKMNGDSFKLMHKKNAFLQVD